MSSTADPRREAAHAPAANAQGVRALERGLDVIECLARCGRAELADLRRGTGLSNATLLRLLASLRARGWVRRNLVEGQYELCHGLGEMITHTARAHPMAEAAAELMLELESRVPDWPADLCALLDDGQIEIIESTRRRGPLAETRTALGIRPSMVFSAHGRAQLAAAPPDMAERLMARIDRFANRAERRELDTGAFEREIALTRERGYALRPRRYWEAPFDTGPELGAIAVAIGEAGVSVSGSISLVWAAEETPVEDVVADGLPALRETAVAIAAEMRTRGMA